MIYRVIVIECLIVTVLNCNVGEYSSNNTCKLCNSLVPNCLEWLIYTPEIICFLKVM